MEEKTMATITAGDFRNGKTFEMDGKVYQVVEFQHVNRRIADVCKLQL